MVGVDRKQREFERREKDILSAALGLFSTPEWESVTIKQIAMAAGIGKGTVYKHFASKDELLFRLMMKFYRGLLVSLQGLSQDGDILQRFRRIFEYALRYHQQHREYRYIVEYCDRIDFKERADESWHASFMELDKAFTEWTYPMFEQAMQDGLISKRPVEQVHMGIHACFEGAIDMIWAGRNWCSMGTEEEVIESVTSFMMDGLIGQLKPAGN